MFNFLKPKITVATHNSSFHADDVFACATLTLWAEKTGKRIEITRTRDPKIIERADIVVDVGMEYNPAKNRFDHHQQGGAGTRENTIPYSSIGLVWKHFADKICSQEAADSIERRLIWPIDARDNGVNISEKIRPDVEEYAIRDIVVSFRPRSENSSRSFDGQFMKAVVLAKSILLAEIQNTEDLVKEEKLVEREIQNQHEPEILVLNEHLYWDKVVSKYKNIKMVICPKPQSNTWAAETPRDDLNDYNSNRVFFPEEWGGLKKAELVKVSGINGAIFCHRNLFLVVASSKQGAIEMAQKALEMVQ